MEGGVKGELETGNHKLIWGQKGARGVCMEGGGGKSGASFGNNNT